MKVSFFVVVVLFIKLADCMHANLLNKYFRHGRKKSMKHKCTA